MIITSETKLTQQATMFSDGEFGSARQEYSLFANETDLGVKMVATRQSKHEAFTREFFVKGIRYEKLEEAAVAAGHNWINGD